MMGKWQFGYEHVERAVLHSLRADFDGNAYGFRVERGTGGQIQSGTRLPLFGRFPLALQIAR